MFTKRNLYVHIRTIGMPRFVTVDDAVIMFSPTITLECSIKLLYRLETKGIHSNGCLHLNDIYIVECRQHKHDNQSYF